MLFLLGMQPFLLFEEDEGSSRTEGNCKNHKTNHKAENAICYDKAEDGSTNGTGSPGDIASLEPHEFKGLLESLEQWVIGVADFLLFSCIYPEARHKSTIYPPVP